MNAFLFNEKEIGLVVAVFNFANFDKRLFREYAKDVQTERNN